MKLLREDMDRSEDESPLDLFNQGIRSEATRYGYTKTLQQVVFLMVLHILFMILLETCGGLPDRGLVRSPGRPSLR